MVILKFTFAQNKHPTHTATHNPELHENCIQRPPLLHIKASVLARDTASIVRTSVGEVGTVNGGIDTIEKVSL